MIGRRLYAAAHNVGEDPDGEPVPERPRLPKQLDVARVQEVADHVDVYPCRQAFTTSPFGAPTVRGDRRSATVVMEAARY